MQGGVGEKRELDRSKHLQFKSAPTFFLLGLLHKIFAPL